MNKTNKIHELGFQNIDRQQLLREKFKQIKNKNQSFNQKKRKTILSNEEEE